VRSLKFILLALLPWRTRYFHVGRVGAERVEPGVATLIRKQGLSYSDLYLEGGGDRHDEPVPETPFYWGRWLRSNMVKGGGYPMIREIDAIEAFVLIRKAS
jgi:hypothetical protein